MITAIDVFCGMSGMTLELGFEEAYQLFHRMYGRKPQWKGMETLFDVLFLFWWGVGWEAEPWAKYQNLGG